MSLNLKHTRRKDYKTEEKALESGIPYLVWKKYPKESQINPDTIVGKRVWVAGTSYSDIWIVKEYHAPGTRGYPEGGLTISHKKERDKDIFLNEAIVHPKQKFK